ncbi:hypothetical protein RRG08_004017 [Elysia crispata]|uniref:Uncharacterized protein n=1 Tax=Elysia crispata TaxID=231223 RepID=A0AAE0Y5X7_9GAST|nr:hypothetical protein RRG08_004017 [Elysia crispata]
MVSSRESPCSRHVVNYTEDNLFLATRQRRLRVVLNISPGRAARVRSSPHTSGVGPRFPRQRRDARRYDGKTCTCRYNYNLMSSGGDELYLALGSGTNCPNFTGTSVKGSERRILDTQGSGFRVKFR